MTMQKSATQAFSVIDDSALQALTQNIADILRLSMLHSSQHDAVIVYDAQCDLAMALTAAYRHCLPDATYIDFDTVTPEIILDAFKPLATSDLVVLIQTTSFRLEAFRIRVELFKRGLKVIEHVHLGRLPGTQALHYITSLAYDPAYYHIVGKALKQKIDQAKFGIVDSGGEKLVFASPFEDAKLNIGDYSGMRNMGGQFPIGEVFTEAQDLQAVNGRVRIFVFGDTNFRVNRPTNPITLVIDKGRVVAAIDSTPEFDIVLANIRAEEGEVWLRELGFGMNRAFSRENLVDDIGTYERMCGIHLSLGAKHGVYNKPNFKRKDTKFHVDVFAITESVLLDDEVVYRNGAWLT
jgi:aminopeptidase